MSSWVSKDGVWHPTKERVGLTNHGKPFMDPETKKMVQTGDPYIYEGPCRAALFELWQADKTGGITTFGQDFKRSPDFLELVRKFNFTNVDDYLAYVGYDAKATEKNFENKASVVTKHELPKKVEAIQRAGGGQDWAGGGNDRYGGFGDRPKD